MSEPMLPEWMAYVWIAIASVLVGSFLILALWQPVAWLIGWARVLRQDLARRKERGW